MDEVLADGDGRLLIEPRLVLVDCRLPMERIEEEHPDLWNYLRLGEDSAATGTICRRRRVWYHQEHRDPSPFLFANMARPTAGGRPFRFILNESAAIATNSYLMMYPKAEMAKAMATDPGLKRRVWRALRAIPMEDLIAEGRTYGRGLVKLEPRELGRVRGSVSLH